jgi:hypothetical protein
MNPFPPDDAIFAAIVLALGALLFAFGSWRMWP